MITLKSLKELLQKAEEAGFATDNSEVYVTCFETIAIETGYIDVEIDPETGKLFNNNGVIAKVPVINSKSKED